jgi:capsid portal protein
MFNVEIEEKEIELMLVKSIDHIHADKISKILMMHLRKDHMSMSQLFKAFMGIIPETNFKVGDVVRVHTDHLPKWRMSLSTMQSNGMLHKNHLSCIITGIDLSRNTCLSISFVYIDNNDKEIKDSYEIRQDVALIEDEMFFKLEDGDQQLGF